jgi:hypothetical protein
VSASCMQVHSVVKYAYHVSGLFLSMLFQQGFLHDTAVLASSASSHTDFLHATLCRGVEGCAVLHDVGVHFCCSSCPFPCWLSAAQTVRLLLVLPMHCLNATTLICVQ